MDIKRSLPSRISWLRAIALISTRFLVLVPVSSSKILLSLSTDSPVRLLVSPIGWVGAFLVMGLWNHLAFVLRGERKLYEIKQNSIREGVNAFKISCISDLVALGFIFICIILGYSFFAGLHDSKNPEDTELYLGILGLLTLSIWFVTIPILYQQELNKQRSAATNKPKKKPIKSTKTKPK